MSFQLPNGSGPRHEVEEAEQLRHAEVDRVALVKGAGDEIERAVEIAGEAHFLLERLAIVVAACVEDRQALAVGRDRGNAGIGIGQARRLLAPAGDRGERADADVASRCWRKGRRR